MFLSFFIVSWTSYKTRLPVAVGLPPPPLHKVPRVMIFYHSAPPLQTKAARKEGTSKTAASPTTSEMLVTLKTFAAPPEDRLILLKGVGTVGAGEVGEEVEVLLKISRGSRLPGVVN